MKKYYLIVLVILVLGAGLYFYLQSTPTPPPSNTTDSTNTQNETTPETTDFTAKFEIYTFGTKRIFSESKYHNQSDKAYFEPSDPSTIQVKSPVTWQEFFDTLPAPMKVTPTCLYTGTGQEFCNKGNNILTFKFNGVGVDSSILSKPINPNDHLIIAYD